MENQTQVHDVCIIGSGPAGLQAGYSMQQKGIDFCLLERGAEVCEFFRVFPRHRQFISINKVHTGLSNPETRLRHDWNSLLNDEGLLFKDWSKKYFPSAEDFVSYAEVFAEQIKNHINCDCDVVKVSKHEGVFHIACADGRTFQARNVIVATGVSRPWDSKIEGIELAENYYDFETDPALYDNKRVLILGKGNSAFETADSLIEHAASIHVMSPNPVRFAWQTHFVGHLRAANNNFLDTYQLKSQNAVIDAKATRIEKQDGVYTVTAEMSAAEGHEIVLTYDHVIACTGFQFDNSIFAEDIKPRMLHSEKFPAMTSEWESETAKGLFFAGTIMQSRDYRKTMSGFVHGFRHNVKCLVEFIACRMNGRAYPSESVSLDVPDLGEHIIDRLSVGSGIFLQPGFLGDVVLTDGEHAGQTFQDVPIEWAHQTPYISKESYLTVTLEYGDFGGNSLHVKRQHNVFGKEPDAFIHPVIRRFEGGILQAEVHLADHLDADWRPRDARAPDNATVLAMTFRDADETLPPSKVAARQLEAFLSEQGIGSLTANSRTAAE